MLQSSLAKIIFLNTYSLVNVALWLGLIIWQPFANFLGNFVALAALSWFPLSIVIDKFCHKPLAHDPHLTLLNMFSSVTFIWSLIFYSFDWLSSLWVLILAALTLLGNLIYTYWFSHIDNDSNLYIKVGDYLPDFTLYAHSGNAVKSADFLGDLNMLVFFRGRWCPICMAQNALLLKLLRSQDYQDIQLYFISPAAKRAQALKNPENMQFFYDRDQQAARKLGINIDHGVPLWIQLLGYPRHTVVPTILLVNREGQVIFSHFSPNYRQRPTRKEYIQYFDMLTR